jgi:hypothetical protein
MQQVRRGGVPGLGDGIASPLRCFLFKGFFTATLEPRKIRSGARAGGEALANDGEEVRTMKTSMARRLLPGLLASAVVLVLQATPVFADCRDEIQRLSRQGVLGDRRAVEEYREAQGAANAGREGECRDHLDRAYSYLESSGYVDRNGRALRRGSNESDRYSDRYDSRDDPRYNRDYDRYGERRDERDRYEGSSGSGIGDVLQRALRGGNSSQ